MKDKFNIEGMMCAACQAHVQMAVSKLNGVSSCNVSLIEKTMDVEYDPNNLKIEDIELAVSKAGYKASLYKDESYQEMIDKQKNKLKIKRNKLIASIILLVLLMIVSMGNMIAGHFNAVFITNNPLILIPIQICLLIPIIVLNFHYYVSGFKALFSLHPNMDSLIAISSLASIIYGLYVFIQVIILSVNNFDGNYNQILMLGEKLYFESAGMILTLVSLGKYFESRSLNSTMSSIYKLMSLAPDEVTILKDNVETKTNIKNVNINDIIVIKPGDKIPLDGTIIEGFGYLDESSLTGESLPIFKNVGDKVISGTINTNGSLLFKCEKIGKDTTLNKIIALVQQASSSKAKISKLVDKISLIFVPIVILISLISFAVWIFISNYNFDLSFNFAISVLVISCPCALGLATPVAIMVGTGKGAQNGILIKSAQGFENLAKVDTIVFDKTGTLTTGKMQVSDFNLPESELDNVCSLEQNSTHPLALALVKYGQEKNYTSKKVDDYLYYPGLGLKGKIDHDEYLLGNDKLVKDYLSPSILKETEELTITGKTIIYAVKNNKYIGYYAVSDTLKETSIQAINELKQLRKDIILLTGDNVNTANYIAKQLGITHVIAQVKPDEKLDIIKKLQSENKKVCMVGDGINDAPSLILSDVGIAIGAGSDIAIDSADIILIRSDLLDVVSSIQLSKKVVKIIKGNLFWAFFYNAITIPLAAGCFYFSPIFISLNPMIGSACMALSSVTVVLNALRLNFFKKISFK